MSVGSLTGGRWSRHRWSVHLCLPYILHDGPPPTGEGLEGGWWRTWRHGCHDGRPVEPMRRGGSMGDDHVTEPLWGRFQSEDAHREDVVMEKAMRRIMGIQVVEGER